MPEKNISKTQKNLERSIDTPVMIALFIVVISIIILSVWKIFFDTSLKGSWRMNLKNDSSEYFYELTFNDNNEFEYSFGGVTYTGRYTLDTEKNFLTLSSSSYGQYNLNSKFEYQVNGLSFGSKELSLTVSSGDTLSFISSDHCVPVIKYCSGFSSDEHLLGSWLYTDNQYGYNYTFTFYDDGRYEYLCSGSRHIGAYMINGNELIYSLITDNGNINEETMKYSINDDELSLITDNFTDILTRTDDKFSFLMQP